MINDFHTHTFFSDGLNSPIELIRYASAAGYGCIGVTDHASYSNIDELIASTAKDCRLAEQYWDIRAIPGVELTNIPAKSIEDMAKYAKEKGAKIVVVHGESPVEKVEPGTNWHAVNSEYVDLLAHPGLLTLEEAKTAAKNGICLEITRRGGHSLANGLVVKLAAASGAKLLVNSDAHSHKDLYQPGAQEKIALAAGIPEDELKSILEENSMSFIKKLGH